MKISKELTKGSIATLVLSVLKGIDLYGYKIIKEIDLRSEHVFALKEGTLYPILHALEQGGCLESYWEVCDNRKRKYYHLTRKGERRLKDSEEEFKVYTRAVKRVLEFA